MKDIKEVYIHLQAKKKERRELTKMFKDELSHNAEYQALLEEYQALKEKKKGIEEAAKAAALSSVMELDALKNEIQSQTELLSDIALAKFMNRETVEIIDEEEKTRLVPVFSVKFKKEEDAAYMPVAEEKEKVKEFAS